MFHTTEAARAREALNMIVTVGEWWEVLGRFEGNDRGSRGQGMETFRGRREDCVRGKREGEARQQKSKIKAMVYTTFKSLLSMMRHAILRTMLTPRQILMQD